MAHLSIVGIILVSSYSFGQGMMMGAESGKRKVDAETIQLLESVQAKLKNVQGAQVTQCEDANGKSCDFTLICNLLKANRNSEVLYQNPEGKVLPNLPLIEGRMAIDYCRNSVSKEEPKDSQQIMNEQVREYAAKRKDFLDSIAQKGEQPAYFAIEKSMVELILESKEPEKWFNDSKEFENRIQKASAKANVKISDESIRLWVAANTPDIPRVNASTNQNPFFDPLLSVFPDYAGSEEKVRANQSKIQSELTRTYNLYLDTKKELISVLKNRKNGSNDAEIDNMIERIEKIKYMKPKDGRLFAGACRGPNAYYDQFKHEFTICPQLLEAPDATIQMIIAHELGHAIDPCIASYTLKKHTGAEKKDSKFDAMKMAAEIALKQMRGIKFDPKIPDQPEAMYSSFDPELVERQYSQALNDHKSSDVLAGIPLSKNPFSTVLDCLQTRGSVSARMGDLSGARKNVLDNIQTLKASGADESHPQIKELRSTLERLDSVYSEKKACGYIGADDGPSQMQEAFADWIASEVTASKVKVAQESGDKERARRISFEANGFFASMSCESYRLEIEDQLKDAMRKAGCIERSTTLSQDLNNMSRSEDTHPEGHARVSRIFMGHPTLSGAIGCKQPLFSGAKYCE